MFRQEALDAQHAGGLGEIVLIRPVSFTFLTLLAAAMALLVVGFFLFGSYTKRSTVSGQLVPASGQVKVHAPQAGIVLRKFVQEGQAVRRGERLMVLSSERYGSDAGPVQAGISRRLEQRRDSLRDELEKLRRLQDDERDSLTSKVASLQRELTTLAAQTDSQQRLLALASDAAARYQGLMDKGYISMDQLQQRQAELLGQRQTLQGLERERTSLRQQLTERRNELAGLPRARPTSSRKPAASSARWSRTWPKAKPSAPCWSPRRRAASPPPCSPKPGRPSTARVRC